MIYSLVRGSTPYRSTDRRARSIEISRREAILDNNVFEFQFSHGLLLTATIPLVHVTPVGRFCHLAVGLRHAVFWGTEQEASSFRPHFLQLFNYHPSFLNPRLSKYLDYRSLEHGRPDCHSFSLDQIMIPSSSASVTLSSFLCCSPEPPTSVHHGR